MLCRLEDVLIKIFLFFDVDWVYIKTIEIQFFILPFKATDSSMVEGDCQIQMGRFISFLQVTDF